LLGVLVPYRCVGCDRRFLARNHDRPLRSATVAPAPPKTDRQDEGGLKESKAAGK